MTWTMASCKAYVRFHINLCNGALSRSAARIERLCFGIPAVIRLQAARARTASENPAPSPRVYQDDEVMITIPPGWRLALVTNDVTGRNGIKRKPTNGSSVVHPNKELCFNTTFMPSHWLMTRAMQVLADLLKHLAFLGLM